MSDRSEQLDAIGTVRRHLHGVVDGLAELWSHLDNDPARGPMVEHVMQALATLQCLEDSINGAHEEPASEARQ